MRSVCSIAGALSAGKIGLFAGPGYKPWLVAIVTEDERKAREREAGDAATERLRSGRQSCGRGYLLCASTSEQAEGKEMEENTRRAAAISGWQEGCRGIYSGRDGARRREGWTFEKREENGMKEE